VMMRHLIQYWKSMIIYIHFSHPMAEIENNL
jgi:hypothetical protein